MARPGKNSPIPPSRQRMIEALWMLLEHNRLNEISVSMLVAEAGCSRSTFYDNFTSLEDLCRAAVKEEITSQNLFATLMSHMLVQGSEESSTPFEQGRFFYRMGLLNKRGGGDLANEAIIGSIMEVWQVVLCPTGGTIKPDAEAIIQYAVRGRLALLIWQADEHPESYLMGETFGIGFLKEMSHFAFKHICASQGVDEAEALARMESVVAAESLHVKEGAQRAS